MEKHEVPICNLPSHQTDIKICHINIRSLKKNFLALKQVILQHNFDVVGISETWLTPHHQTASLHLPLFHLVRKDRKSRRGGGVAVYIRRRLAFDLLLVEKIASLEQVWVCLTTPSGRRVAFGVVYRPPAAGWDDVVAFEGVLAEMRCTFDDVVCVGDFNVDLRRPKRRVAIALQGALQRQRLAQVVTEPTRLRAGGDGSLLDLVLVSHPRRVLCHGQLPPPGSSDHNVVFLTYQGG